MTNNEVSTELPPERGYEMIPKRGCDDEVAQIDVPFQLDLDNGDRIVVTITRSGRVKMRPVEPRKMFVLGTVTIDGFKPEEAQAIAKSFLGGIWSKLKAVGKALLEAVTVDGGPYLGTCKADVQAVYENGVLVGGTVGIKCIQ